MAAIRPLRRFQVGLEATRGTPVAPTRLLRGSGRLTEVRTTYRTEHPYGVRARGGGAGVIVQRSSEWEYESELSLEELRWFLGTGLAWPVVTGSADPYTWTYTPQLGSAAEGQIATMTVEFVESDGATNHYVARAAYGVTKEIAISAEPDGITTLRASGIARSRTDVAPATPAAYASRTTVPGALWQVYWDPSWASVGTTQLQGTVRSMEITITTGWDAGWTLDGRSGLDWTHLVPGLVEAKVSLTLELDAVAAGRISAWRSNDEVAVRMAAQAASGRSIQMDLNARLADELDWGEDGEVTTVGIELEGVATSAGDLLAVVLELGEATLS